MAPNELSLLMNRLDLNREQTYNLSAVQSPSFETKEKPILITSILNEKLILKAENVGYFRYKSERKLWEIVLDDLREIILRHNTTADVILDYSPQFIQIHKSYILNIDYLNMIHENTCVLQYPFEDVEELKVSKNFKKRLLAKFSDL